MSLDAIALLPISLDTLRDALRIEHEEGDTVHFRVVGRTLRATSVEGGSRVALDMRFDTPPATLGTLLRRDFGALLDNIDRVLVYPSVARPEANSYDALIEEIGEGGEWIDVPDQARSVGANDAMGVFQGLAQGLGPDMMGQMQQIMRDPGAMGQLAGLAQGLLADDGMRSMMEGMMQQMQRGEGDLMDSARALAQKAQSERPGLFEEIGATLGASGLGEATANDDMDGNGNEDKG